MPEKTKSNHQTYIRELIARLESDKKMVMIIIMFELAIILFSGKEIITSLILPALSFNLKLILTFSMLCLLLSAWFNYLYYRRLHLNELALPKFLIEGTYQDARDMIFNDKTGLWAKHGYKYTVATYLLTAGILLYIVFFVNIIFK